MTRLLALACLVSCFAPRAFAQDPDIKFDEFRLNNGHA
jgi:hypothetical protein